VNTIRFEWPIKDLEGFRADAVSDDTIIEVLVELRDARRLRTALMEMARITSVGRYRAILMLEDPHVTESRLQEEWKAAAAVFRPELMDRLSIAIRQGGKWKGLPRVPDTGEIGMLNEVLEHTLARRPAPSSRVSEAYYEILRILIYQWLLARGPVTINRLMEISGTSHPTVSKALKRLDHSLIRHSDRSVELRYFPRDEWARLLAVSPDVRATVHFADRSGHARSPESLLRRLKRLGRKDIAVGGVLGAKHYQPSLDLIGNPRLDLSVHSAGKSGDFSFVKQLDPALEKTIQRDQPAALVIHTIHRAVSLFQLGDNDVPWADPVECLIDLHEARLEPQALAFLNSFQQKRTNR
jgi:CRP-like cAMP-binding protein